MEYEKISAKWFIIYILSLLVYRFILPFLAEPLGGLLALLPGAVLLLTMIVSFALFLIRFRQAISDEEYSPGIYFAICLGLAVVSVIGQITNSFGICDNLSHAMGLFLNLVLHISFLAAGAFGILHVFLIGIDFLGDHVDTSSPVHSNRSSKRSSSLIGGAAIGFMSTFADNTSSDDSYDRNADELRRIDQEIRKQKAEIQRNKDEIAHRDRDTSHIGATESGIKNADANNNHNIKIAENKIAELERKRKNLQ